MSLNIGELNGYLDLDDSAFNRKVDGAQGRMGALGGSIVRGLGRAVATGAVALGTLGAAGTFMGIKTAAGLEQADIAFTTMLGSAAKAHDFLGQLAAFASSTPFEFPELQTAASSLISVGIDASKVIPIMTSLGNATSGMGTGSEGIKRATVALQQMSAAGKITGEDLNQLRDAGIPVFDLLAAATGKSKKEIAGMAQEGKLGARELRQLMSALESGKGLERFNGLMDKQSQSLTGLWSTFKDTMNMGLAEAVQPLVPLLKDGLGAAIEFLTAHMPALATGMATVVDHVRGWFAAQNGGQGVDLAGIFDRVSAAAAQMWPQIQSAAQEMEGIGPIVDVTGAVFGFLADHLDTFVKYLPLILAGVVAWKLAQAAANGVALARLPIDASLVASNFALAASNRALAAQMMLTNGVEKVGLATRIRATVATVASGVASLTASAATKVWAATQWLLNAALTANPIGLVVLGIAALAAGIIYAYKHSETFRNVIGKTWDFIKTATGNAVGLIIDLLRGYIGIWMTVVGAIINGAAKMFGWVPGVGGKLKKAAAAFNGFKDQVDDKLGAIADSARGWGEDVATGFADGIDAKSREAVTAAGGMANRVNAIAKATIESSSPSRVHRRLGRTVPEGMAAGINDRARLAIAAVSTMANKIAVVARDALADAYRSEGLLAGAATAAGQDAQKRAADGLSATQRKNRAAYQFEHQSARQQLADIDARLAHEKKYSDAWMADMQQRDQIVASMQSASNTAADTAAQAASDRAQKVTDKAQAGLDKVSSKLDDIKSKARDARSSVGDSIRGVFDISRLGGSPVGAMNAIAAMAAKAEKFSGLIQQLTASKLDPALVAKIASDGPETGMAAAAALSRATRGQVNAINSSYGQINASAAAAGNAVAADQFGKQLRHYQRMEHLAEETLKAVKQQNRRGSGSAHSLAAS